MIKDFSILTKKDRFIFYAPYNNLIAFDKRFQLIQFALDPVEDMEVNAYVVPEKKFFSIWSENSFKEQVKLDFNTLQQYIEFEERYDKYYDKRWEEIPKIRLSIQDWEILKQKWKKIKKEKPKVIVYILDDSGPLDKVDIIGKDELSEQDKEYIKQEHEKYLKYEKARQKYIQSHSDYSEVWRGPQDDEYEVDILKYYDQDE